MTNREECVRLLLEFVRTGDIDQAATAAGTVLAYLAPLRGTEAQLAAMDDLQVELARLCEEAGISEGAEERHVVIEDAIEQARRTLKRAGMSPSPFT